MQETSHNVEAAVDHGVNDPSTDKCKVIFIFIVFIHIFLNFHAHQCVLLVHFSIPRRLEFASGTYLFCYCGLIPCVYCC